MLASLQAIKAKDAQIYTYGSSSDRTKLSSFSSSSTLVMLSSSLPSLLVSESEYSNDGGYGMPQSCVVFITGEEHQSGPGSVCTAENKGLLSLRLK